MENNKPVEIVDIENINEINTDDEVEIIANLNINDLGGEKGLAIPLVKSRKSKKTGEVKTYTYDQKKYNDKYYQKHKDEMLTKITCPLCRGTYTKSGLSNHIKTKKHQNFVEKV